MGFSRQEYLSGLPAAKPGNLKTEVWRMCCFLLFGCAWSLLLEVAYLLVVVQGLLTAEASLAAKRKLSSCDSWAWLPHSMWGLHGRGIKFVPPRWQWTLNQSTAREAQVCILELHLQLSCRFEVFQNKVWAGREFFSKENTQAYVWVHTQMCTREHMHISTRVCT